MVTKMFLNYIQNIWKAEEREIKEEYKSWMDKQTK